MAWKVDYVMEARGKLDRLLSPGGTSEGGRPVPVGEPDALAERRGRLVAEMERLLSAQPYGASLGTARADRQGRVSGSGYVSVLQDDVEALHAWWCHQGHIRICDVEFTPCLRMAESSKAG